MLVHTGLEQTMCTLGIFPAGIMLNWSYQVCHLRCVEAELLPKRGRDFRIQRLHCRRNREVRGYLRNLPVPSCSDTWHSHPTSCLCPEEIIA